MEVKMNLQGYIVLVSGGTGGLGREVVNVFLKKGATVVTNYRREESFKDLKSGAVCPERLEGIEADLSMASGVAGIFEAFQKKYRRLDAYLHLMGGFWMGGELAETPLEKWEKMLQMNLTSAFLCCQQAFAIMKNQSHGKIFTVAAKAALDLPAGMGAYAVSKTGVLALTEILAKEGRPYNIQVNSILPSIIDTPANREAMPDADFKEWVSPAQIGELLVALTAVEQRVLNETALKVY